MTRAFASGAARLAALAGQGLGWRPAEFWAATPAELALILAPPAPLPGAPLTRAECAALMETLDD
ncbi:phage tail assembly chaperone [Novosphingobium sp.]|uniref:phage tail assembly chaperone n=1 Tax=Novosphingobium sp. TaxID=1874826 RepID=UPI0026061138|nr:phage tail assembly chaperone [Novosphingobium sp.]